MADRQYSGNTGSPIKLRTNAPKQTEEQVSPRYRYTPRTSREIDEDADDGWTVEKSHTSAYRYDSPSRQTTHFPDPKKTRVIRSRRIDRATLMIWCCLAVMIMIAGWWLLSWLANWWQGVQDNLTYGTPRTFQADQYVGQGDSPEHPDHFIALNLHGVIEVVQINPLDSKQDTVFVLTNVNNESIPASLSFRDTTGKGRLDILVTIGESNPYTILMLNNGKTFQPTQPVH